MKQVMLEDSSRACGRKKSLKPTDKNAWWWSERVNYNEEKEGKIQAYERGR